MLTNENKNLTDKIAEILKEIAKKEEIISKLTDKIALIIGKHREIEIKYGTMEENKRLLTQQLAEMTVLYENQTKIKTEHDTIVTNLTIQIKKMELELHTLKQDLTSKNNNLSRTSVELEHTKTAYQDINNKYLLLLNDNNTKQITIDEKSFEILNLTSKVTEIEKKNVLLETARRELTVKITEFINKLDTVQLDLLSTNKRLKDVNNEKDEMERDRNKCISEIEQYQTKLSQSETAFLEKITGLQNMFSREKEDLITRHETAIRELKDQQEGHLVETEATYRAKIADLEKKVAGLTAHIKSLIDTEYLAFSDVEKVKIVNDKLRSEQVTIDQKIAVLVDKHRREMEELRMENRREKDELVQTYNETNKKTMEMRLSQSTATINTLKETNQKLERQLSSRDTDDYHEKYSQLKNEYATLKEKLERSIELNNAYSVKEKQQDGQLKQLQSKYNQLITLTKKSINSST